MNGSTNGQANGSANGHAEEPFLPYLRDERLVRPWAIPGTPGLEHRIGGSEKGRHRQRQLRAANHQHMIETRAKKVADIAAGDPRTGRGRPRQGQPAGRQLGRHLRRGAAAVQHALAEGKAVAHCHLRYLNPFPRNLGEIIKSYEKVLIPELNAGNLRLLIAR